MVQLAEVDVQLASTSNDGSQTVGSMISTLRAQKRIEGMKQLAERRASDRNSTSSLGFGPGWSKTGLKSPTSNSMAQSHRSNATEAKRWSDTVTLFRTHEAKKKYIIDPRSSTTIAWWDGVAALALFFTALVTPYEVAFLDSATVPDGPWVLFVINRFVDLIFLIDLCLQFFIAFPDRENNNRGGAVKYIFDMREIALNYLTSWFLVDALSVSVSAIDIVVLFVGDGDGDGNTDEGSRAARILRVPMRLLRVLRLFKLLRLLRTSRLLRRWETRMSINYGFLTLARCVTQVMLCIHWMACAWKLQAELFAASQLDTWLGAYGYCRTEAVPAGAIAVVDPPVQCAPHGELYVASLYWATLVTTGLGGGELESTMLTVGERVCSVVLMLMGSLVWANVVATLCGVINLSFNELIAFRRNMDELNMMMGEYEFPNEVRRRLREFFHQSQHLNKAASYQRLTSRMSPKLQGEVAMMCNGSLLRRVGCFSLLPEEFVARVANTLRAYVFVPLEQVTPNFFYLVHSGIALYGGAVYNHGGHWGEDVLLLTRRLKRYRGVAMTYLQVFRLSFDDLRSLAETDPFTNRLLRRYAIVLMLKRYLLDVAARQRALEAASAAGATGVDGDGSHESPHARTRTSPLVRGSPSRRSLLRSNTLEGSELTAAAVEAAAGLNNATSAISRQTTVDSDDVESAPASTMTFTHASALAPDPALALRRTSSSASSQAGARKKADWRQRITDRLSGTESESPETWERRIERRQVELSAEMASLRADVRELCQMARSSRSMYS